MLLLFTTGFIFLSVFLILIYRKIKKRNVGVIYFSILRILAIFVGFAANNFKYFTGGLIGGIFILSAASFLVSIIWSLILFVLKDNDSKIWIKYALFYFLIEVIFLFPHLSFDRRMKFIDKQKKLQASYYKKGLKFKRNGNVCQAIFYLNKSKRKVPDINELEQKCLEWSKSLIDAGRLIEAREKLSFMGRSNYANKYIEDIDNQLLLSNGKEKFIKGKYFEALSIFENILENSRNEYAMEKREETLNKLGKNREILFEKVRCVLRSGDIFYGKSNYKYRYLFYVSRKNGKFGIWSYDLKERKNKILIDKMSNNWSPFIHYPQKLYFVTDRNGNWDIFSYDLLAKTEMAEIVDKRDKSNPQVSLDGNFIAFAIVGLKRTRLGLFNKTNGDISIIDKGNYSYGGMHRWFGQSLIFNFSSQWGNGIKIYDVLSSKIVKTIFAGESFNDDNELSFDCEKVVCSDWKKENDFKMVEFIGKFTYGFNILKDKNLYDEPVYSPDGKLLAFTSYKDLNSDIYIFDLIKRKKKRITFSKEQDFNPQW